MKKLVFAALAAFVLISNMAVAADSVAYVNMPRVLQEMPQKDEIGNILKREFADRVEELKRLEGEMQGIVQKAQKDGALMGENEQIALERQLEGLKSQYELKKKALEEDNRRRQADERNKLLLQVQDAINKVAKAEGLAMVFNTNALVYAADNTDITDKVIAELAKTK
ncbi:molecular chaperone [Corallincola holothuriorum]|uniref:Molecular chaperone n=1 Tax=Corallincola holothuriorum TaxID=2282215 RepID=A0A368NGN1_9GAMM|nr:OmpH family outer membrane protein [Corallincola holothuriorum]RCU48875.1 molecular chaperone [Corallincola holothuriorum]